MKVLNHAGVSVSYDTAWNALRHLTAEARCLEVVRSGHWLWVYDNLNIRVVRHERKGNSLHAVDLSGFHKMKQSLLLYSLCTQIDHHKQWRT